MMLDHRLKAFCLLAELKSFSKAARAKHITQSAMSHIIKNLEEELGVKLVNRHKKSISLTPAGRVLYEHAKKILLQYKLLVDDVHLASGKIGGDLHIGVTQSISTSIMPRILYLYRTRFPDIKIHLTIMESNEIVNMLEHKNIDIGLIERKIEKKDLVTELFIEDTIVAVATDLNPLCSKDKISLQELYSQYVIMPERGSDLFTNLEMVFKRNGIELEKLKIAMVTNNLDLILKMAVSGLGVSFVYKTVVQQQLREGALREILLTNFSSKVNYYMLYYKNDGNRSNIRYLIQLIKRLSPQMRAHE